MEHRQELTQEPQLDSAIIGTSNAAIATRWFAQRAALCSDTLLLLGETGAGKDRLAEHIHELGSATGPFVPVDCGVIPKELAEAELFGHEAGAFTGAVGKKPGLIQGAEGGTLFLNEIGNLSYDLQAKILRFVEGKSYRQVGGTRELRVNTRIIAGTNLNLENAVGKKTFRSDLYYRLNTITYTVPPLRERRDDIPILADYFLSQGQDPKKFSAAAQAALRSYDWPGNVRELRSAVRRSVFYSSGSKEIGVEHVEPYLGGKITREGFVFPTILPNTVEHEVALIKEALTRCKGHQDKAGKLIGLTSRNMSYRIYKFKLEDFVESLRES